MESFGEGSGPASKHGVRTPAMARRRAATESARTQNVVELHHFLKGTQRAEVRCVHRARGGGGGGAAARTSMMLAPAGPTVLTMWTFGVEVERCLCSDCPSPPGRGKWKAGAGERSTLQPEVSTAVLTGRGRGSTAGGRDLPGGLGGQVTLRRGVFGQEDLRVLIPTGAATRAGGEKARMGLGF